MAFLCLASLSVINSHCFVDRIITIYSNCLFLRWKKGIVRDYDLSQKVKQWLKGMLAMNEKLSVCDSIVLFMKVSEFG